MSTIPRQDPLTPAQAATVEGWMAELRANLEAGSVAGLILVTVNRDNAARIWATSSTGANVTRMVTAASDAILAIGPKE